MKNSKSKSNGVDKIVRSINLPYTKRKLTFLFGAGINFDIAKENSALSWNQLASKATCKFLKKNKKYTNFELKAINESLIQLLNNNKIALSFYPKNLELEIKSLSKEENSWFIKGFKKLNKNLREEIEVFTLNYDTILEENLNRKSLNFLNSDQNYGFNNKVVHLHGIINDKNIIEEKSILTLESYVEYAQKVTKDFSQYLLNKTKKEKDVWNTIIIVGTRLDEEHLLSVFKEIKEKQEYQNIFLIDHFPKTKILELQMEAIYNNLGIKWINIKKTNNYKNDFINFWNQLTNKINKNNLYVDYNKVFLSNNIDSYRLYNDIKNKILYSAKTKKISLDDMFNILNIKDKNIPQLINIIFSLETKDKILEKDSFRKFYFNNLKQIPLHHLNKMDIYQLKLEEINKVLNEFEATFDSLSATFNTNLDYELDFFIEKYLEHISKADLIERPNILLKISKSVISNSNFKKINSSIKDFIIANFSYSEIRKINKLRINLNKYPNENSTIYKLFKKDLDKNKLPMSGNLLSIPKNLKELFLFIEEIRNEVYHHEIITLFLFKNFNKLILENYKIIIKKFDKKEINKKQIPILFILHKILYFLMIESDYKSNYLKEIRKIDCIFEKFPEDINLLGHGGSMVPDFSEYDGLIITENYEEINSFEEVEKLLKEENISVKSIKAALNYIQNNFSLLNFKKLFELKQDFSWGYDRLDKIKINFEKWNEYKKYIEIKKDFNPNIFANYFIKIIPPHNIEKRIDELVQKLNINFNKKFFEELDEIILIKHLKNFYHKESIWLYNEIWIALKYFKESSKTKETLNIIFENLFSWENDNFVKILKNEKIRWDDYHELEFAIRFQKNYQFQSIDSLLLFEKSIDNYNNFAELIDYNARFNKDPNSQTTYLIKAIDFFESLELRKNESNITKLINTWKNVIIYNYINYEINIKIIKSINFNLYNLYKVLDQMNNFKKEDSKIALLFENAQINVDNQYFNVMDFLELINKVKLGEKAFMNFFELIISPDNKKINEKYYSNELFKFERQLTTSQKEKLKEKKSYY